jgi:hypothetical protein
MMVSAILFGASLGLLVYSIVVSQRDPWFTRNVFFISWGKYWKGVDIHFLPKYTYRVGLWGVDRKKKNIWLDLDSKPKQEWYYPVTEASYIDTADRTQEPSVDSDRAEAVDDSRFPASLQSDRYEAAVLSGEPMTFGEVVDLLGVSDADLRSTSGLFARMDFSKDPPADYFFGIRLVRTRVDAVNAMYTGVARRS